MTFCVVLQERGIQERLLDNFESQYMSFSLKLQIAAALHQTTRLQVRLIKKRMGVILELKIMVLKNLLHRFFEEHEDVL